MDGTKQKARCEVAMACLEIQSTWSPAERMKRLRADLRPSRRLCDGRMQDIDADAYDAHLQAHVAEK